MTKITILLSQEVLTNQKYYGILILDLGSANYADRRNKMDKKKGSFEEAKNKAKGFFGYIKHLVKAPVKTVPEAKARRKEVLTFTLISLGVAVIPVVINRVVTAIIKDYDSIISKILNIPTMIGVVGVIFSLFLFFVLNKITAVVELRECKNCKEQIMYDDNNITYKVLREWVKKAVLSKNGTPHVEQTEMAEVEINCICQNCGTPKQFKREFRLAYYYDGDLKYSYKLDNLVKGFFTGEHIQ